MHVWSCQTIVGMTNVLTNLQVVLVGANVERKWRKMHRNDVISDGEENAGDDKHAHVEWQSHACNGPDGASFVLTTVYLLYIRTRTLT